MIGFARGLVVEAHVNHRPLVRFRIGDRPGLIAERIERCAGHDIAAGESRKNHAAGIFAIHRTAVRIATQQRGLFGDFLCHADKGDFGVGESGGNVFGAIGRARNGGEFGRQGCLAIAAGEAGARDQQHQHDCRAVQVQFAGARAGNCATRSEMAMGHRVLSLSLLPLSLPVWIKSRSEGWVSRG